MKRVLVLAGVGIAGCGGFERSRECTALVAQVNAGVAQKQALAARGTPDSARSASELRELAAIYASEDNRIGAAPPRVPALLANATAYRTAARTASEAAEHLARTVEVKSREEAVAASGELARAAAEQADSVARINTSCRN